MDALKADGAKAPAAQTQVDTTSAAVLMYTSGTTGNPKGVRLSYRAYECNRATFLCSVALRLR